MAELKEARVPDIGGYDGVPVIEVLVAVGDTVTVDQGLVTLESDKATMEVPAPFAGVVRELKVKVGDEIGEGAVVAMIEPAADGAAEGGEKPAADASADTDRAADKATDAAKADARRAEPASPGQQVRTNETATATEPANVGEPDNLAKREAARAQAEAGADDPAWPRWPSGGPRRPA